MLSYILAGLTLGSVYALLAGGVVISYVATGVLNMAFGAQAYFVARFFYYLHVQHNWGLAVSAIAALALCGPLLGLIMWAILFRSVNSSPPVIKMVVTIGVLVTLPPLASLAFGNQQIGSAPGLAPEPVTVYHVFGTFVTLDQVISYACVVGLSLFAGIFLRYTSVGLSVRALVDSETMTALSGTSPALVSMSVWMVMSGVAGLAGILAAPTIGLTPGDYTILLVGALAAVIAGRLTSAVIAIPTALLIGVAGGIAQRYLPASSTLTADIIPSIPFILIAICLSYRLIRYRGVGEDVDQASFGVAVAAEPGLSAYRDSDQLSGSVSRGRGAQLRRSVEAIGAKVGPSTVVVLVALAVATSMLGDFWVSAIGDGLALAIVLLSFTLVTGEGGMIWLCQITLAGIGAVVAAQVSEHAHLPILIDIVVGGAAAAVVGAVIAVVTIKIGELYLPLVTLTFALLVENLIFTRQRFSNSDQGVTFNRPDFASSDRHFAYLLVVCFLLLAIVLQQLRSSTAGAALTAVRSSAQGAQSIGLNIVRMRLASAVAGAFVAGVGGAFLASYAGVALPSAYDSLDGLVWFAVLITFGSRSYLAALLAGLTYTLSAAIFLRYLPVSVSDIPPALFGLGAVAVIRNPDGIVAMNARQFRALAARFGGCGRSGPVSDAAESPAGQPEATATGATTAVGGQGGGA